MWYLDFDTKSIQALQIFLTMPPIKSIVKPYMLWKGQ